MPPCSRSRASCAPARSRLDAEEVRVAVQVEQRKTLRCARSIAASPPCSAKRSTSQTPQSTASAPDSPPARPSDAMSMRRCAWSRTACGRRGWRRARRSRPRSSRNIGAVSAALGAALAAAYAAHAAVEEIPAALQRADVAFTSIFTDGRATRVLGRPRDQQGRVAAFFREATKAGLVDAAVVPEALR